MNIEMMADDIVEMYKQIGKTVKFARCRLVQHGFRHGCSTFLLQHRFSPDWSTRLTIAHSLLATPGIPDNQELLAPHIARTWMNGHAAEGGKVHAQLRNRRPGSKR